jgi:uncharacterized protein YndB with AHSA1/START domain
MTNAGDLRVEPRGERGVVITRSFQAPRHLVFEAMTRPELIQRWMGVFGGWSFDRCDVDLRVGGAYHYVWRGPDEARMGMHGTFREIAPPERIVATEAFDDPWFPGELLVTTVLTERGGRTTMTMTTICDTTEVREAILNSGMEQGLVPGYAILDEILAEQAVWEGRTS